MGRKNTRSLFKENPKGYRVDSNPVPFFTE